MASSPSPPHSHNNNNNNNNNSTPFSPTFHSSPNRFDPNSIRNTTFVQTDPSTFRAVVQRLTGGKSKSVDMGPRRGAFKLHERRPTAKKLEIKLNNNIVNGSGATLQYSPPPPNSNSSSRNTSLGENMVMVSPVSPLEFLTAARVEQEDRAIADKGFYLHHPSPLTTPRGSDPPELLPLFPLHSPT
ncbi:hypothetical protein BUALT_Bualt02G0107400 [Buddleja alternifolia]|uniref:VQ domain-containing protein n=1 Tax=Buddleja alternifolia TaxID=168488 RepID=A0AAV6Y7S9_9LAMI|nr:hypothetical protein BUALT_Bualt02G0107400 [Buddleja alternifolia]